MKKLIYITSVFITFLLGSFLLHSCLSDDEDTLVLPELFVDINDPYDLQKALWFKDANQKNGDLPASTAGNRGLSSAINSILVNSGATVSLPLIYSNPYGIEEVYIQVTGADGRYYAVSPSFVPGTENTYGYISIVIPKNINDGTFYVEYKIKDSAGNISNEVKTIIQVTNEVVSCQNASASGSSGLTFTTVLLGDESGSVSISYNTYTVKDRIDIYQGEQWITGTGSNPNSPIPPMCDCNRALDGFVGKSGYLKFDFDSKKGKFITVVVSGCLNGGTAWDWRLDEAPNCK